MGNVRSAMPGDPVASSFDEATGGRNLQHVLSQANKTTYDEVLVGTFTSPAVIGGVASVAVSSGGSGYVAPTVTASGGGATTQATFSATVSGGVIQSIAVLTRGVGYSSPPTITITDTGGSGAVAVATIGNDLTQLNYFDAGNAPGIDIRSVCSLPNTTINLRVVAADANGNPLGVSAAYGLPTTNAFAGAGYVPDQIPLYVPIGSARKYAIWPTSVPGGSWKVYARPN